jgi:hypothetical protein
MGSSIGYGNEARFGRVTRRSYYSSRSRKPNLETGIATVKRYSRLWLTWD